MGNCDKLLSMFCRVPQGNCILFAGSVFVLGLGGGASKCVSEKNELLSWGDSKYQYISEDN